jgi:hypothetical protein
MPGERDVTIIGERRDPLAEPAGSQSPSAREPLEGTQDGSELVVLDVNRQPEHATC